MSSEPSHRSKTADRDRVWHLIDAQRCSVADLLQDLSDDEWQQPSLCSGWTVREVAAHLTLQQVGPGAAMAMMAQWRGSLDRTIQHVACRRAAALSTGQIIAEIRGMVGSRRRNFGVTCLETLIDILVHGQDIAIPLGRSLETPAEGAAIATSRLLTMRWPPPQPSARTLAGFRLRATDIAWSVGEGPAILGPMAAILLVCTGRLVALPQLSGDGAAALTARLTTLRPT